MDIEEFLEKAGGLGRFQKRVGILLALLEFPCAFQTLAILFTAAIPKHFCGLQEPWSNTSASWSYHEGDWREVNVTDGVSIRSKTCFLDVKSQGGNVTESLKCSVWDYDNTFYDHTIVNQWDLVCDSQYLVATAGSLFMVGFMIGSFAFGLISDRFGRKMPFLAATFLQMVLGVATAFSPSYIVFVVFRVLNGIVTIGQAVTGFVLSMELTGNAGRAIFGCVMMATWGLAYLVLSGIGFLIRDWWILQLVATIPSLLMLSYFFIIPESPRWLLMHNRKEDAQEIIRKIAKENGYPDFDVSKVEVRKVSTTNASYVDLVKTPKLRIRSLSMAFIWMTNSLVYYGLTFNTGNLAGNPYVNHAISATVETVSCLAFFWMIEKLGRKISQFASLLICGLALLAMIAVPDDLVTVSIVLAMTGKFLVSATFGMVYIYTAEVFPTVVRNQAVGGGSFSARIGSIVAPYIAQLGNNNIIVPAAAFGTCSLVAAALMFFVMPETKGRDLPDTIEDGERLGRKERSEKSEASKAESKPV